MDNNRATGASDSSPNGVSWPAAGIYALVAVVLLLLIMAVTAVLARQPRILTGRAYRLQAGWQPVTDAQAQFTLNHPPRWTWVEAADADAWITANPHVVRPFQLFQTLDADLTVKMVGTETSLAEERPLPLFVVVARSRRLQPLPVDRLVAEAATYDPDIQQAEELTRPGGVTQAQLFLRTTSFEPPLQCQIRFQTNQTAGYLIAGCTEAAIFGQRAGDIDQLMQSFQLLETVGPKRP